MIGMKGAHHAFGLRAHEGIRNLPENTADHHKRDIRDVGEPERHVQSIRNNRQVLRRCTAELGRKLSTGGARADDYRLKRPDELDGSASDTLFFVMMDGFPYFERVVRARDDRLNSAAVRPHQYAVRVKGIEVASSGNSRDAKHLLQFGHRDAALPIQKVGDFAAALLRQEAAWLLSRHFFPPGTSWSAS